MWEKKRHMQNSMNPVRKVMVSRQTPKGLVCFSSAETPVGCKRRGGGGLKFFVICPSLSNNKSFVALCPDPGSDVLVSCDFGSRLFAPQTQSQPSVAASGAGTSEECVTKAADKTYH